MASKFLKDSLVRKCVDSIVKSRHPKCNKENIFNHPIYSRVFLNMLRTNMGQNDNLDEAINELISDVEFSKTIKSK